MGFFGSNKKNYLGVDIGGGGIKLVELQNEKGRARLFTYGFTGRKADEQTSNMIDKPKETAELLKKVVQKAKTSTKQTVAGLPLSSVFSSVISVTKGSEKDVREAIQVQVRKLIPVPLEEMVLDFKPVVVPDEKKKVAKKDEKKQMEVLVTGASKTMVQKYVAIFKEAGLELISLETEAFALIRSLVGKDRATSMIVDIGASRTNIIIVENGIPYVTRSLDMGGVTLTKTVSRALSVDLGAAEQMKCDMRNVPTLYPGEGLPKIFETSIAPLLTELQYSLSLFVGQSEQPTGKMIEKIILSGGSSAIPSLTQFLARQLNIKTYIGDPWARIVYSDELRPALEEIGPRFAVPVGLAMRDIE